MTLSAQGFFLDGAIDGADAQADGTAQKEKGRLHKSVEE